MNEKEKIQFLKSLILSKKNQINKFKFKIKKIKKFGQHLKF